jgi:threonine aldolase
MIDLRSDTVTRPTPGMRQAMAAAEVGDDVYGEDPTVQALEARVAALFGHEAALFAPTGSMANQIAIQTLVPPAHELLCDADAHVVTYEIGAAAAIGGVSTRTWGPSGGAIDVSAVAAMVRPDGFHAVPTRAIAVEQTHNRSGGEVIPLSTLQALRSVADEAGIGLHCDGARIWHAHVATAVPLTVYGGLFDTLSVCLSKGLGTPIGSVFVSTAERVAAGRVIRKRMGGGMRQVGVLAAARSTSSSLTSRWVISRHSRGPSTETSTPPARARPASVTASTVDFDRSSRTMFVCTAAGSTTPNGASAAASRAARAWSSASRSTWWSSA